MEKDGRENNGADTQANKFNTYLSSVFPFLFFLDLQRRFYKHLNRIIGEINDRNIVIPFLNRRFYILPLISISIRIRVQFPDLIAV